MSDPVPPTDPVPAPEPVPPDPPAKGWVKPGANATPKPEPKPEPKAESNTGSVLGGLGILVTIGITIAQFVGGGGGNVPPPVVPPNLNLLGPRGSASFKVWDATTGAVLAEPAVPAGIITAVAFSPDGKKLAGGSSTNCLFLWNLDRLGAPARLDGFSGTCFAVAFSPDGTRVAGADDTGVVRVWDAANPGPPVAVLPRPGKCDSIPVVALPAADRAVVEGPDDRVRVWRLGPNPGVLVEFDLFETWARGSGARIAFARDGAAEVWDTVAGTRAGTVAAPPKRAFRELAFVSGGRLAAVLDDGSVRVFDATGKEQFALAGFARDADTKLAGDGDRLYTASRAGVAAWDAATGARVVTYSNAAESVERLARHGPHLVGTGPNSTIVVWRERRDGNEPARGSRAWSAQGRVWLDPNGRAAIAQVGIGRGPLGEPIIPLSLIDPATGNALVPLAGAGKATGCLCVAFRPDGRALAAMLK